MSLGVPTCSKARSQNSIVTCNVILKSRLTCIWKTYPLTLGTSFALILNSTPTHSSKQGLRPMDRRFQSNKTKWTHKETSRLKVDRQKHSHRDVASKDFNQCPQTSSLAFKHSKTHLTQQTLAQPVPQWINYNLPPSESVRTKTNFWRWEENCSV